MTPILDFTINYRSDDEQFTPEMLVSAPKSQKINKLSNSEPQIKKRFNLHFDSHFVSYIYEDKFRGHFEFFLSNVLALTFSPNPLCYHKYVILSSTYLAVYL